MILVDHIHPNYIQQGISSFSFTQKMILCPLKHEAIILNKMQLKHIKSKVYLSKLLIIKYLAKLENALSSPLISFTVFKV